MVTTPTNSSLEWCHVALHRTALRRISYVYWYRVPPPIVDIVAGVSSIKYYFFSHCLHNSSIIHDSIQLKQNFKKMKRSKSSGSSGSSSADEDKASRRALAMVRWSEILTDVSFPRSLSLPNYFTAPTFLSRARSNQRAQYYHPYIVSHCARTAVCIAVNTTKEHAFLLIYLYLDFQPLFALFFCSSLFFYFRVSRFFQMR